MYDTYLALVNKMHEDADKLDDDSAKTTNEAVSDHRTAVRVRMYANELQLLVAQDMSWL